MITSLFVCGAFSHSRLAQLTMSRTGWFVVTKSRTLRSRAPHDGKTKINTATHTNSHNHTHSDGHGARKTPTQTLADAFTSFFSFKIFTSRVASHG